MKIRPSVQILLGLVLMGLIYLIFNKDNLLTQKQQEDIFVGSGIISFICHIVLGVFTIVVAVDISKFSKRQTWNFTKQLIYESEHSLSSNMFKFVLWTRYINLVYWIIFGIKWIDRNYKK